jgi:ADP-heptose:LPS heptosyltransferase
VPVFALFGPTSAIKTGPYGKGNTVITSGLPCAPCFKKKCEKGTECMESITVEQVLREIESFTLANGNCLSKT